MSRPRIATTPRTSRLARLLTAVALASALTTGISGQPVAQARDAGQSIAASDRGIVPDIFATGDSTCATLATGQLTCWGKNSHGQLGDGTTINRLTPQQSIALPGNAAAVKVTGSTTDTCALLSTGQVSCWGRNEWGVHGNGTTDSTLTPSALVALPGNATAIDIASGDNHACALLNTGEVTCWGRNSSGQLGTGDNSNLTSPPATPVGLPGPARSITSGAVHMCALLNTGQISCWGRGIEGQLGNGARDDQHTPTATLTLPVGTTATSVVAGSQTTCALLNTGEVTCWGDNSFGQLGDGTTTDRDAPPPPLALPDGATATEIAVGERSVCALLSTAAITCWGNHFLGQLGNGTAFGTDQFSLAGTIALPIGTSATSLTVGGFHACAFLNTGDFTCWGFNGNGALGNDANINENAPTPATSLPAVDLSRRTIAIAVGGIHTCALLTTGEVSCWGRGVEGQLGTDDNDDRNTPSAPIELPGGSTAVAIAAGFRHTCAILHTGDVSCWGVGDTGQLGTGDNDNRNTPSAPIELPGGSTAIALTAGERHTCALLITGQISCWGRGIHGQIGDGNSVDRNTPSEPITLPATGTTTTATAIGAGEGHTCAVLNTGDITCWGQNNGNQAGQGGGNQASPVPPIGLPTIGADQALATAVAGGNLHSCGLLEAGQVSCWGNNTFGTLGTGGYTASPFPSAPITLPGGTTAIGLTAGRAHGCALLNTGQVSCWGAGQFGQLGTGNTAESLAPSAPLTLPAGTTATSVQTALTHTCALLSTGQIACWGFGFSGQLGIGSNTTQSTPSLVTFPTATPTIAAAVGQRTPTNDPSIKTAVTFDRLVTDFDASDITLGGTAGPTTASITGTGSTYEVTITGMTGDGDITIEIPAGTISAYGNTASNPLTIGFDTTGPVLGLPADIEVNTMPDELDATVTYTASATDAGSTAANAEVSARTVPITCLPASGSKFPIGVTTVDCQAVDTTGNKSSGAFAVRVIAVITAATTTTTTTTPSTTTTAPTPTTTTTPPTTIAAPTVTAPTPPATMPTPDLGVELPATGTDSTGTLTWWAFALVAAGLTIIATTRRRRSWN